MRGIADDLDRLQMRVEKRNAGRIGVDEGGAAAGLQDAASLAERDTVRLSAAVSLGGSPDARVAVVRIERMEDAA